LSNFKSDQQIPPTPRVRLPRTPSAAAIPRGGNRPPSAIPTHTRATPPAPIRPKPIYVDNTATTGLTFPIALFYVFALFSLGNEFSIILLGVKPYFTWVTGPIAIIAAVASGNLFRAWDLGPGRWLILFTFWMMLATPFAIYHAGSIAAIQEYTLKQLPVLFMLAALITSLRQVEWFCRMMAFAGLMMVGISLRYGGFSDNRFMLPGTSLENPNDFATHLLLALPFCLLMMLNSSWIFRIIGIASSGSLVLIILRSGSRGGFIALMAMVAIMFWKMSGGQRVVVLAVCIICGSIAMAVFPQILWDRFKTILSTDTSAENSTESRTVALAEASTNGRMYLLRRSLEFTARHPIFGLGPGNFIVAEAADANAKNERGSWLGTHNSYTQASSEGGIPAFLFFAAAVVSAIRINGGIYRRTRQRPEFKRIANIALCLMLTLIGFAVNILFSHLAFRYYLPMLAGLTVAFSAITEREIRMGLPQMAQSRLPVSNVR
jgi:putative inorganic carbon (HCO3(-)) transporter